MLNNNDDDDDVDDDDDDDNDSPCLCNFSSICYSVALKSNIAPLVYLFFHLLFIYFLFILNILVRCFVFANYFLLSLFFYSSSSSSSSSLSSVITNNKAIISFLLLSKDKYISFLFILIFFWSNRPFYWNNVKKDIWLWFTERFVFRLRQRQLSLT